MKSRAKRTVKTSLWLPGFKAGAWYCGVLAGVAGLKDYSDWLQAFVDVGHAHPIWLVGAGVVTMVGNILLVDNEYHDQQRKLDQIRMRPRPPRSRKR